MKRLVIATLLLAGCTADAAQFRNREVPPQRVCYEEYTNHRRYLNRIDTDSTFVSIRDEDNAVLATAFGVAYLVCVEGR